MKGVAALGPRSVPVPLRLLILEDEPDDAELMLTHLRAAGFNPLWRRVDTEPEYISSLRPDLDVILADHALSRFSSLAALQLLRERQSDIPFIVVSGHAGEEAAVSVMQRGASDYLLKDRLAGLGPAVQRALEQRRLATAQRHAEERLHAGERRFRALIEHSSEMIALLDPSGTILYASPSTSRVLGYASDALVGRSAFELIHPDDQASTGRTLAALLQAPDLPITTEYRMRHESGAWQWIEGVSTNLLADPSVTAIVVNYRDTTKRKEVEAARLQQAALIESSDDAIISKSVDGIIASWNRGAEQLYGYSAAEMIGQPVAVLLPPERRDELTDIMRRVSDGERVVPYETVRLRKNGTTVDVSLSVAPITDAAGRIIGACAIARDITESKRVERALRESEARTRAIVDTAVDGIITTDQQGIIRSFNPAAARIFGYTTAEVIGRNVRILMPEPHRSAHDGYIANFVRTGVAKVVGTGREAIGRHKNGTEFPMDLAISEGLVGEQRAFIGIARNISERKRAEHALRQYAERFDMLHEIDRHVLAGAPPRAIAAAGVRRLRGLVPAVQASVTLFDFAAGQARVLAADPEDAAGGDFGLRYATDVFGDIQALREGKTHVVEDVAGRRQGPWRRDTLGGQAVCSYVCVPLLTADAVIGTLNLGAAHHREFAPEHLEIAREAADELAMAIEQAHLHERVHGYAVELEHQVAERTAALQQVNAELEAFAYSVSHDLRAPLRSIDAFGKALLEECSAQLDTRGQDYLRRVRGATQRMGQLIALLLELARVTRAEMRHERVDLSVLAAAIAAELQQAQPDRTVHFVITEGVTTSGDPRLLRVLLENLLGNAWKFTAKHATANIEFGVAERGGERIHFVRDDGAGFDARFADKLFVPFQRLHTAREFEGTGVGLATVQRIVHRHGGRTWAEGAVDHGATIYFTLGAPVASV